MIKQTIIATFCALIGSFMLFAWYHQWIIIMVGAPQPAVAHTVDTYKKNSVLFFPKASGFQQETKEIVYSKALHNALQNIVQEWLQIALDEHYIPYPLQLQSAAFSFNHDELILSFNGLPFDKEAPIEHKLQSIHALLKTVAAECPHLQKIYFFCNHKPFEDDFIDFSRPWPLDGFESETLDYDPIDCTPQTIIIHPWGDAKHAGRKINSTFERTYTLEYAQYLKKHLESVNPDVRVIITRSPGNIMSTQQAAEFANKLHADLYITLNCYQTAKNRYPISCFYLSYQPSRSWQKKVPVPENNPLKLIPVTQVHRFFEPINKNLAHRLLKQLKDCHGDHLEINTQFSGLPLKLLQGASCPSLALEIGIPQKEYNEIFLSLLAKQLSILLSKRWQRTT